MGVYVLLIKTPDSSSFTKRLNIQCLSWFFNAKASWMLHFAATSLFFLGNRIRSISSQKVFLRAVECGSWVAFGYIGQAPKMLSATMECLKHKLVARNICAQIDSPQNG